MVEFQNPSILKVRILDDSGFKCPVFEPPLDKNTLSEKVFKSEIDLILVKIWLETLEREDWNLGKGFRKFSKLESINVFNNISSVNKVDALGISQQEPAKGSRL